MEVVQNWFLRNNKKDCGPILNPVDLNRSVAPYYYIYKNNLENLHGGNK